MRNKGRAISIVTMNRLYAAWMACHEHNLAGNEPAKTMRDAFAMAGLSTNTRSNLFKYRRQAEETLGKKLPTLGRLDGNSYNNNWPARSVQIEHEKIYQVIVSSDHHYMPGETYPAHAILLQVLKDVKPKYHIINGDAYNCGPISRFGRIGWEEGYTLVEEYEAALLNTDELAKACRAKRLWGIGNHCIRAETFLSNKCPEWEGMPFTTLDDLFPKWEMCWSIVFNDQLMVKHRFHNGVHAARNNTLHGGVDIITGHTHRLQAAPFTDYRGTRYGVEAGTIADPGSIAFSYAEDNPKNWQEGFLVVTIDGRHVNYEMVHVKRQGDGAFAVLRGKRYEA